MISINELVDCIKNKYAGVVVKDSYKEIAIFFNPDNKLKNGVYICTIKESDGPNDKASKLNRDNLYRLSCGLDTKTYKTLFGIKPKRPPKGGVVEVPFDFTKTNVIMPHPIYAWMCWVCVNSPDKEILEEFLNLIDISYEKAKINYYKKFEKTKN